MVTTTPGIGVIGREVSGFTRQRRRREWAVFREKS
jgi:hypothetical protein